MEKLKIQRNISQSTKSHGNKQITFSSRSIVTQFTAFPSTTDMEAHHNVMHQGLISKNGQWLLLIFPAKLAFSQYHV